MKGDGQEQEGVAGARGGAGARGSGRSMGEGQEYGGGAGARGETGGGGGGEIFVRVTLEHTVWMGTASSEVPLCHCTQSHDFTDTHTDKHKLTHIRGMKGTDRAAEWCLSHTPRVNACEGTQYIAR